VVNEGPAAVVQKPLVRTTYAGAFAPGQDDARRNLMCTQALIDHLQPQRWNPLALTCITLTRVLS
jgi:hypothetical protein